MSDSNSCQVRSSSLKLQWSKKETKQNHNTPQVFIEATTLKTSKNTNLPYTNLTCSQGSVIPGLNQRDRLVLSSLEELD